MEFTPRRAVVGENGYELLSCRWWWGGMIGEAEVEAEEEGVEETGVMESG
jgi:hypothetical protein